MKGLGNMSNIMKETLSESFKTLLEQNSESSGTSTEALRSELVKQAEIKGNKFHLSDAVHTPKKLQQNNILKGNVFQNIGKVLKECKELPTLRPNSTVPSNYSTLPFISRPKRCCQETTGSSEWNESETNVRNAKLNKDNPKGESKKTASLCRNAKSKTPQHCLRKGVHHGTIKNETVRDFIGSHDKEMSGGEYSDSKKDANHLECTCPKHSSHCQGDSKLIAGSNQIHSSNQTKSSNEDECVCPVGTWCPTCAFFNKKNLKHPEEPDPKNSIKVQIVKEHHLADDIHNKPYNKGGTHKMHTPESHRHDYDSNKRYERDSERRNTESFRKEIPVAISENSEYKTSRDEFKPRRSEVGPPESRASVNKGKKCQRKMSTLKELTESEDSYKTPSTMTSCFPVTVYHSCPSKSASHHEKTPKDAKSEEKSKFRDQASSPSYPSYCKHCQKSVTIMNAPQKSSSEKECSCIPHFHSLKPCPIHKNHEIPVIHDKRASKHFDKGLVIKTKMCKEHDSKNVRKHDDKEPLPGIGIFFKIEKYPGGEKDTSEESKGHLASDAHTSSSNNLCKKSVEIPVIISNKHTDDASKPKLCCKEHCCQEKKPKKTNLFRTQQEYFRDTCKAKVNPNRAKCAGMVKGGTNIIFDVDSEGLVEKMDPYSETSMELKESLVLPDNLQNKENKTDDETMKSNMSVVNSFSKILTPAAVMVPPIENIKPCQHSWHDRMSSKCHMCMNFSMSPMFQKSGPHGKTSSLSSLENTSPNIHYVFKENSKEVTCSNCLQRDQKMKDKIKFSNALNDGVYKFSANPEKSPGLGQCGGDSKMKEFDANIVAQNLFSEISHEGDTKSLSIATESPKVLDYTSMTNKLGENHQFWYSPNDSVVETSQAPLFNNETQVIGKHVIDCSIQPASRSTSGASIPKHVPEALNNNYATETENTSQNNPALICQQKESNALHNVEQNRQFPAYMNEQFEDKATKMSAKFSDRSGNLYSSYIPNQHYGVAGNQAMNYQTPCRNVTYNPTQARSAHECAYHHYQRGPEEQNKKYINNRSNPWQLNRPYDATPYVYDYNRKLPSRDTYTHNCQNNKRPNNCYGNRLWEVKPNFSYYPNNSVAYSDHSVIPCRTVSGSDPKDYGLFTVHPWPKQDSTESSSAALENTSFEFPMIIEESEDSYNSSYASVKHHNSVAEITTEQHLLVARSQQTDMPNKNIARPVASKICQTSFILEQQESRGGTPRSNVITVRREKQKTGQVAKEMRTRRKRFESMRVMSDATSSTQMNSSKEMMSGMTRKMYRLSKGEICLSKDARKKCTLVCCSKCSKYPDFVFRREDSLEDETRK